MLTRQKMKNRKEITHNPHSYYPKITTRAVLNILGFLKKMYLSYYRKKKSVKNQKYNNVQNKKSEDTSTISQIIPFSPLVALLIIS